MLNYQNHSTKSAESLHGRPPLYCSIPSIGPLPPEGIPLEHLPLFTGTTILNSNLSGQNQHKQQDCWLERGRHLFFRPVQHALLCALRLIPLCDARAFLVPVWQCGAICCQHVPDSERHQPGTRASELDRRTCPA